MPEVETNQSLSAAVMLYLPKAPDGIPPQVAEKEAGPQHNILRLRRPGLGGGPGACLLWQKWARLGGPACLLRLGMR